MKLCLKNKSKYPLKNMKDFLERAQQIQHPINLGHPSVNLRLNRVLRELQSKT